MTQLIRFVFIHINITKPLLLWKIASKYPLYLNQLSCFVDLCAMTHVNGTCELCKCRCVDFVEHFFCNCIKMSSRREKFWNMVSNQYDIALEVQLHNLIITLSTPYLAVQFFSFLVLLNQFLYMVHIYAW